jgi:glycosyltransferase involved in cell wall biosynthesis
MRNIELVGKFFDNHSLSIVNRNIALSLKDKVNLRCVALDEPTSNSVDKSEIEQIVELTKKEEFIPEVQVRHSYPPIWNWPISEKTKIAYIQPWEYRTVPFEWQYKFETFADLVIAPSKFNISSYTSSGLNPSRTKVVPNGYNPNIYYNKNKRSDSKIKILYVGCHQFRKGVDILLKLWSNATKNSDNLSLTIKDTPSVYGQSDLQKDIIKLQYNKKCAEIIYDDSSKTDEEMADMYNEHHILVHPYRGEGFGMHIQEAMACGCIPIVTAGGATDDFVVDYKINSSARVVNMYDIFGLKPEDSSTMMGQHKFVLEPDINDFAAKIQEVLSNIKNIEVNTEYLTTWEEVGDQYVNSFEYLLDTFSEVKRRE